VYRTAEKCPRKPVAFNETADKVPERNVGGFAGWASPNEFTHRYLGIEASIMHCCMGNGTRALYYVWEHIVDFRDHELKVNLLMNRASPWADVYSHVPYEGRVDVKMKKGCGALLVRAPEWIESGSALIKATRNGSALPLTWQGRYVKATALNAGDRVQVAFPINDRTVKQTIAGVEYTLDIRGNTVVSMSPGGENIPLYKREHLKADKAPPLKVKRFVSEQFVSW